MNILNIDQEEINDISGGETEVKCTLYDKNKVEIKSVKFDGEECGLPSIMHCPVPREFYDYVFKNSGKVNCRIIEEN